MNLLEKRGDDLLLQLLSSFATEEVEEAVSKQNFTESDWQNYGGRSKNFDTVNNQQSNPVGALTELITNSIDAILMQKAKENGWSNS